MSNDTNQPLADTVVLWADVPEELRLSTFELEQCAHHWIGSDDYFTPRKERFAAKRQHPPDDHCCAAVLYRIPRLGRKTTRSFAFGPCVKPAAEDSPRCWQHGDAHVIGPEEKIEERRSVGKRK